MAIFILASPLRLSSGSDNRDTREVSGCVWETAAKTVVMVTLSHDGSNSSISRWQHAGGLNMHLKQPPKKMVKQFYESQYEIWTILNVQRYSCSDLIFEEDVLSFWASVTELKKGKLQTRPHSMTNVVYIAEGGVPKVVREHPWGCMTLKL